MTVVYVYDGRRLAESQVKLIKQGHDMQLVDISKGDGQKFAFNSKF